MAYPVDYPTRKHWYCLVCDHEWTESSWDSRYCPKCKQNDKRRAERLTRNMEQALGEKE